MGNLSLYASTSCVMRHRWRVATRDRDKKSRYNLKLLWFTSTSLLPDRENRKMCRVRVHCDVWICINLHISFIVTYLTEWFFYNFIMTHWWCGVKSNRDKKHKVLVTINSGLLTGFWKKIHIARDFGGKLCLKKGLLSGIKQSFDKSNFNFKSSRLVLQQGNSALMKIKSFSLVVQIHLAMTNCLAKCVTK